MPNEIAAGAAPLSESRTNEKLSPWWRRATLLTMAVGLWNFIGAGIFGFLITLPIVSYFETGTLLTINHSHAAMAGVFGMMSVGLVVFAVRETVTETLWRVLEKYVRVGFWGLNGGLLMMVVMSLFPAGVLQLVDVLENGYWHARSLAYTGGNLARLLEWCRMPGDVVFIVFGVVPIAIAAVRGYLNGRKTIPAVPLVNGRQQHSVEVRIQGVLD